MGANLAVFGFSDKIKTAEQALKDANKRGEEDRYENGNSYSGSMGMLHFRFVNRVFDTLEDFEKMFDDGGPYTDKGDGIIAQVRVLRETKPLAKAKQAYFEAQRDVNYANWRMGAYREKAATPGQMKRLVAKMEKTGAKYKTLIAAQAAKSTKTKFVGGGWCSS